MLLFCIDEDIKLNSQVFHWPENIKAVFELSQNRIMTKREHIEEELRSRTRAYEDRLNDMMKDVESFKKKEVCLDYALFTEQFILNFWYHKFHKFA